MSSASLLSVSQDRNIVEHTIHRRHNGEFEVLPGIVIVAWKDKIFGSLPGTDEVDANANRPRGLQQQGQDAGVVSHRPDDVSCDHKTEHHHRHDHREHELLRVDPRVHRQVEIARHAVKCREQIPERANKKACSHELDANRHSHPLPETRGSPKLPVHFSVYRMERRPAKENTRYPKSMVPDAGVHRARGAAQPPEEAAAFEPTRICAGLRVHPRPGLHAAILKFRLWPVRSAEPEAGAFGPAASPPIPPTNSVTAAESWAAHPKALKTRSTRRWPAPWSVLLPR